MIETTYPVDDADLIDAEAARRLCGDPSDATWKRWHRDAVILYFMPVGTNRRRYSRRWILDWYRRGARGAVAGATSTPSPGEAA